MIKENFAIIKSLVEATFDQSALCGLATCDISPVSYMWWVYLELPQQLSCSENKV